MVDAIISRISGPVAVAKNLEGAHMFDVEIGRAHV